MNILREKINMLYVAIIILLVVAIGGLVVSCWMPKSQDDVKSIIVGLCTGIITSALVTVYIENKYSPTVIVAVITSKEKMKLPTHIAVPEMEGLEKDSVVLLEQLRILDKRRLENYVCTLDCTEMEKINKALKKLFQKSEKISIMIIQK